MIVNVEHTKIEKIQLKKHDYADIVSTISNIGYSVLSGMDYDMSYPPLTALYVIYILSGTSSSILQKMKE